jgi:hypothetical protein
VSAFRLPRDVRPVRYALGIVRNFLILAVVELTPPDLAAEADAFLARLQLPDAVEIVARAREALRLQSAAAQRIGRELASAL